jgi:hypothetical protein
MEASAESGPRPGIYQLVLDGAGDDLASLLRYRIAEEAIDDPKWREVYDRVSDAGGPLPEQLNLPRRTWRPDMVLLRPGLSSVEAGAPLWVRILELRETVALRNEVDVVAAAVAGELWLAAHVTSSFNAAAAYGPDAATSLAAILARGVSERPSPPPGMPSAQPSDRFNLEWLEPFVSRIERWVATYELLGREYWPEIVARVVADLGHGAYGGSITHEVSLALASREIRLGRAVAAG